MIDTARLRLRTWRDDDRAPFAAMSASVAVMRHLGGPSTPAQVDDAVARLRASQAAHGFSFWAVERRADRAFLGFCGLKRVADPRMPIDGEVEIGWRLREDAWGQGYACEAAAACLDWGWATLPVDRIVAMTVPANAASRGLMARLGMRRRPGLDFGHPAFAPGHPLHAHVVSEAVRG